jgi:uncharacterized protein YhhL (DUF1145 family)
MSNSQTLVLLFKVVTIGTWLLAAAAFLMPPSSTFGGLGRTLFYLLFAIHALECVAFLGALRRTGRPLVLEVMNTLFFGVIHYIEVKQILAANDAEESAR